MSNSTMKMKNEIPLVTVPSRSSLKKHAFYGILAVVSLLGLGITQSARANFVETISQVGINVVATGSGTIDLAALNFVASGNTGFSRGYLVPFDGWSALNGGNTDVYNGFSGPLSFGGGGFSFADSSSGAAVAIFGANGYLHVPQGYVSDSLLSGTSTYDNTNLGNLGLAVGTYTWTWGTGADADSFTLQIGGQAGVPDAGSTFSLLGLASLGLVALRRKLRC